MFCTYIIESFVLVLFSNVIVTQFIYLHPKAMWFIFLELINVFLEENNHKGKHTSRFLLQTHPFIKTQATVLLD